MATPEPTSDALAALRELTLEQLEQRLAELDGERASLSLLRRSLVARQRAQKRAQGRSVTNTEGRRDG